MSWEEEVEVPPHGIGFRSTQEAQSQETAHNNGKPAGGPFAFQMTPTEIVLKLTLKLTRGNHDKQILWNNPGVGCYSDLPATRPVP